MKYRINNWHEHQHYKNRAPSWIKLHHTLLTSEVWVMGDDASRTLAIVCMLLAARSKENDGTFNGDPEYVKRFGYLNYKPNFKPLIDNGFIELVQDASDVLAQCTTEKRREETEESREEDKKTLRTTARAPVSFPDGFPDGLIEDFKALRKAKRSPLTQTALDSIEREAVKAGIGLAQAIETCCQRGWAGFKAEWVTKDNIRVLPNRLTVEDRNREVASSWVPPEMRGMQ